MGEPLKTSIKLNKKIFNNKEVIDFIEKDFSQLIQSDESITIERLFGIYRELFYKIKKQGKTQSHHSIII